MKPWVKHDRNEAMSLRPFRFDLIDPFALLELARVMHEGAVNHKPDGWRDISVEEHLSHAMAHIQAYRYKEGSLDHLPRAFTRLMMAVALTDEGVEDEQTEGSCDNCNACDNMHDAIQYDNDYKIKGDKIEWP